MASGVEPTATVDSIAEVPALVGCVAPRDHSAVG